MTVSDNMETLVYAQPVVSVVIPTFNRAHLLPKAIASVLAQTISNFELVIVDDGSTDNTVEVVNEFSDIRIKFLPLGKNYGGNYARNQGIKATNAELVAFLDSDDEWLPRKLELQLARLEDSNHPQATVVYCQYCEHQELTDSQIIVEASYEGNVFDQLLKGWCPALSTFMIKHSSILEVGGFDETLPSFQDYDLFLRLAEAGNHFVAVSNTLVKKSAHKSHQVSGNWNAKIRGFEVFQNRWGTAMKSRLGFWAYRKWVSNHLSFVRFKELQKAVDAQEMLKAWQQLLAISYFLPWSGKSMVKGLVFLLLGRNTYRVISRSLKHSH
ncbi:MAG: glycosyltransferase family 2 protein [Desmonostoc vinosum HA7617-LM4]|jgi:glycosyltransferase involved in cell wall biosynthesis|nr:glycosyltransferase family 2 protein [Desmonostoc vinosum HA7617-LM4]